MKPRHAECCMCAGRRRCYQASPEWLAPTCRAAMKWRRSSSAPSENGCKFVVWRVDRRDLNYRYYYFFSFSLKFSFCDYVSVFLSVVVGRAC